MPNESQQVTVVVCAAESRGPGCVRHGDQHSDAVAPARLRRRLPGTAHAEGSRGGQRQHQRLPPQPETAASRLGVGTPLSTQRRHA